MEAGSGTAVNRPTGVDEEIEIKALKTFIADQETRELNIFNTKGEE